MIIWTETVPGTRWSATIHNLTLTISNSHLGTFFWVGANGAMVQARDVDEAKRMCEALLWSDADAYAAYQKAYTEVLGCRERAAQATLQLSVAENLLRAAHAILETKAKQTPVVLDGRCVARLMPGPERLVLESDALPFLDSRHVIQSPDEEAIFAALRSNVPVPGASIVRDLVLTVEVQP